MSFHRVTHGLRNQSIEQLSQINGKEKMTKSIKHKKQYRDGIVGVTLYLFEHLKCFEGMSLMCHKTIICISKIFSKSIIGIWMEFSDQMSLFHILSAQLKNTQYFWFENIGFDVCKISIINLNLRPLSFVW